MPLWLPALSCSPEQKIGPNELWGGAPAKFIKMVDPAQSKEMNIRIAKNYLMYSKWYDTDE